MRQNKHQKPYFVRSGCGFPSIPEWSETIPYDKTMDEVVSADEAPPHPYTIIIHRLIRLCSLPLQPALQTAYPK